MSTKRFIFNSIVYLVSLILFSEYPLAANSLENMEELLSQSTKLSSMCSKERKHQKIKPQVNKYRSVFQDTIWVVPPETLLAIIHEGETDTEVLDQTIWVIETFEKGYFTGQSYTSINGGSVTKKNLVGSVTNLGDVYITFYDTASTPESSISPIVGIGKLICQKGEYVFVMQMSSESSDTASLSHWSYMVPVSPKDCYYQSLPGVGISVPTFIALGQ